jgi:hypothetical protein
MYDGIPLIAKWLDVIDTSGRGDIDLSFNSVEILAVNQPWYVYRLIQQYPSVFMILF